MSETAQLSGARTLASRYSQILAPALVLAMLVVAAGFKAGMSPLGVMVLLAGIVGVPGLIYKCSKGLFRRWGLPDRLRIILLAALTFTSAAACFMIPLGPPVPLTVAAFFVGNAGLVFFRRWLDVSAHVSVVMFAALWVCVMYGGAWAWLLMLSPLMIFSRVSLGEHTWGEALAGAALGLATFFCYQAVLD